MVIISSGEDPISTSGIEADALDPWVEVLEITGTELVNYLQIVNEGDWPGFWRIAQGDNVSPPVRLPCGGGESGERRASVSIPCVGLSGAKLQIKRSLLGGHLTGIYAYGIK